MASILLPFKKELNSKYGRIMQDKATGNHRKENGSNALCGSEIKFQQLSVLQDCFPFYPRQGQLPTLLEKAKGNL